METGDFARRFAIDGAFLQILPLVMRELPVPYAELRFNPSIFPIELEHNKSTAFDLRFAVELIDLLTMEEKFADPLRSWDFVARLFVGLNIGVVEKDFALFNPGKGVADVRFAGANGFNFAALQLDSRLVPIEDVKIAKSLAIEDRLSRHTVQADACG